MEKLVSIDDIGSLSDDRISEYQKALMVEVNRRLRLAAIPRQIREVVLDARRGGELSDDKIRAVFDGAMTEPLD